MRETLYRDDLLLVDEEGKCLSLVWCLDIYTLLKERLEILARTRDAVLNSTYDGIIAINPDGRITIFNEAAGRMIGCDRRKAIGTKVEEVVPTTQLV